MKKTLVTLMALAGVTFAADPIAILDSQNTHVDLTTTTTAAYLTAVMNMTTFETLVTNQTSDCLISFNINGVANVTQVGSGTQGNTLKSTTNGVGSAITSYYTPNPNAIADLKGTLDFDSLKGAVLTFAYDSANSSRIILTTLNKQGEYTDYVSENGTVKWSGKSLTGANIDSDYVTSAYVYNGTWNGHIEDIKATAHSLLVPEPATATLSLLALAGLAARRKRH